MEGNYAVYFGENSCGRVLVEKQGLYYRFLCRCSITGAVVCRLYACFEGDQINLGVLVPLDGGFGLDTRLPVKQFPAGTVRFCVAPKAQTLNGQFVPIVPEEPFAYIERLKDAFLVKKYGQTGVMFF